MRTRSLSGLLAATAASLALSASSCSLIINTDADQCQVDADCAAQFPGRTCRDGVCVAVGVSHPECKVNADCKTQGAHVICRKDTLTCVSLTSPECTTIHGDDTSDNAFIIGSILPTTGPDTSAGKPLEEAITLAMDDIKQATSGLPPVPGGNGEPRPLVLVGCSDDDQDATALAAAKHLAEEVGVPAIIGGAFSGATLNIANNVTIKDNVLLFSPSATSTTITTLDDKDLVWRTSPSDTFQATALSFYVPTVEAAIKADPMIQTIRVAVLNKGDAYGRGLAQALELILNINGMPALQQSNNYKRIDYGMGDQASLGQAVSQALLFKPHIVLIFGGDEGVSTVFTQIEEQWPAAVTPRPRYIFSDGGELDTLWNYPKMTDELRKRISGTAPGVLPTNKLFAGFRSAFLATFSGDSPDVFGAPGAYDITYLLAYAAAGLGAAKIDGPSLAQRMKMMSSGPAVNVAQDIPGSFTKASMGSIDFNGASGPLNFDPKTGEAPSDIQIWCLPSDGMGKAAAALNSGYYYDASTGQMAGSVGASCN